jgi:transposase
MWIADLMACGLIKASFVPEEPFQELRSLMRTRKQLGREQTRHVQRIQKTLEEANIKLDSVITDVLGVSGRRMIEAMIAGVRDPYAPPWLIAVSRPRRRNWSRRCVVG